MLHYSVSSNFIKKFYYYYQSGKLIFGDSISDIIHQLAKTPDLLETEITRLFGNIYSYADNTLYKDIYRVEPEYMVHIGTNGRIVKSAFWQVEQEGSTLHYRDDREYLEHFTSNTYKKREGLHIIPTLDIFKAQWERGVFQAEFQKLPFKHFTQDKSAHKAMIKNIQAFMLNECFNHNQ
jgi:hypothetical protein